MKCISARKFAASLAAAFPLVLCAADPPPGADECDGVGHGKWPWTSRPTPLPRVIPSSAPPTCICRSCPTPISVWVPYNVATNYITNGIIVTTNVSAQYHWRNSNTAPPFFARLQVTPMSSNALLTAIVLNRLAYGPTPDELERVTAIGPQAYIDEQLAPETITETIDSFPAISNIAVRFVEATTPIYTNNASTNASIADLRAWHVMRGVGAKRQLLEILLQFLENHFVTQYSKSANYFDRFGLENTTEDAGGRAV